MEPFDRRAWMAEDNQEGGGGQTNPGTKVELARSKEVLGKGGDEPEPQSATVDEEGVGETQDGPKAGRTGTVVAPARD